MSDPEVGSWWQKTNTGAVYKIVCITNHKGEFLSQPVESFMAGQYKKVADAKNNEYKYY